MRDPLICQGRNGIKNDLKRFEKIDKEKRQEVQAPTQAGIGSDPNSGSKLNEISTPNTTSNNASHQTRTERSQRP